MIDKVNTQQCCLCGNCKLVCPTQAISFRDEVKTFLYPIIDNEKCIGCDKCESVCPSLNSLERQTVVGSFAAKHKQKEIRRKSSSGGIFTALAECILLAGGIVYGAAFQNDFSVKHISINKTEDIEQLRGSKYVQSDLDSIFLEIKKKLHTGKKVLFSGTPCQCAALKAFLKDTPYNGKLYVVDFICHGILSDKLFHEYIRELEIKHKSKIVSFQFRNKKYGWLDSGPLIKYQNGREDYWPLFEDIYMQGYFQGICMRESCYKCAYKNFQSGTDLTMGDFWGAQQLIPDFYEKSGVSLLYVNTAHGQELLEQAKQYLDLKPVAVETLARYNQGLLRPFEKGKKSDEYYCLAERKGNIVALKEITQISKIEQCKRLYRRMRRFISMRREENKNGKRSFAEFN